MHRMGDNKKALNELNNAKGNLDPYLFAQVNYKLGNYQDAAATYLNLCSDILTVDPSEICDLLTNTLACSANDISLFASVMDLSNRIVCPEKTYEYFFNLSQTLLKGQHF